MLPHLHICAPPIASQRMQGEQRLLLPCRQMNGSSVNTYTLINFQGKVTYTKFQWKPSIGVPLPPHEWDSHGVITSMYQRN